MQNPRNLSWLQFNQVRKFPLLADTVPTSVDGAFVLPDDLLTGIYISYNSGTPDFVLGKFYISRLINYTTGCLIYISYVTSSGLSEVAEAVIDFNTNKEGDTLNLLGRNCAFLSGHISIGSFAHIKQQPIGEWTFDSDATTLDPFCIRLIAKELSSLYISNNNETIGPFYGNLTIQGGTGIKITATPGIPEIDCIDDAAGTTVTISADSTVISYSDNYVKSINGIIPDASGNIDIVGQDCLYVSTSGSSTITLEDTCAKPCCTCEELQPIESKIVELIKSQSQLQSRIENLYQQALNLREVAAILVARY